MKKDTRDNRQTPSSSQNVKEQKTSASDTLVGFLSDLSAESERVSRTKPRLSPVERAFDVSEPQDDRSARTNVFLQAYLDADDSSDAYTPVSGGIRSSHHREEPVRHQEQTSLIQPFFLDDDEPIQNPYADEEGHASDVHTSVSCGTRSSRHREAPVRHQERTSLIQPYFLDDEAPIQNPYADEDEHSSVSPCISGLGGSLHLSPNSRKRDTLEIPVTHQFEGTNEIFIQSSAFDLLWGEDEFKESKESHEKTDKPQVSKLGLPSIPPPCDMTVGKSLVKPQQKHDSSNFFGIVSSGILPTVEIDKSFDMPCLDEAMLAQDVTSDRDPEMHSVDADVAVLEDIASSSSLNVKLTSHTEGTSEVFISKLVENVSDGLEDHVSDHALPKVTQYGLPARDASAETALHPDDLRGALRRIAPATQFAVDTLYHPRRGDLLGVDVEGIGVERYVAQLWEKFKVLPHAQRPITVFLKSTCGLSIERVTRSFLLQCAEQLPGFQAYTSASASDGTRYDLVTTLVASRLGCFPNAPEKTRMEMVINGANKLFAQRDSRWGMNILCVRYGLSQLLANPRDVSKLAVRNDSDMLELLLNIIQHDALHGPVVIAISRACLDCGHAWRDILRQLQVVPSGNILILLMDGEEEVLESLRDVETLDVSHLHIDEKRAILYQTFAESDMPMAMVDVLVEKSGPRFVDIRRLLCLIRERGLFQALQNVRGLDGILEVLHHVPKESHEISEACYEAFGQAQRRFLSVASLFGDSFYLSDLAFILSLEPLEGEIAWFRNLRVDWCERVAESLVFTGELIAVHTDDSRGVRYNIPDAGLYRSRIQVLDPALHRRVHGCYAHLLVRRDGDDAAIAEAFEQAHLWPEHTRYVLKIAKKMGHAFYNRSAYAILQKCLSHIGPQHDQIYAELLKTTIEQAMRLGKYDEACACAEIQSRYGYLIQDALCSCTAFLQLGTCLRMQGEYARAQDVLLFAIKHAETKHHDRLIAMGYHALAELVLDVGEKGALVNALRYAEKSLEISRKGSDLTYVAMTQTLCARIYMLRGEPQRAKNAATEAYQALTVSERWYDTPWPMAVLAESSAALGESLPLDYLERGFEIADKTGNVAQQFALLCTRLKMTIHTLQRQAVRDDLAWMAEIIEKQPLLPWIAQYHYFVAQFDYSRKNFHKTSDALKIFFDHASTLGNTYLMSQGYALSAVLNFEVHRRKLGKISLEKTEKLYRTSTAAFEAVGAWHDAAENLRCHASFLEHIGRGSEAESLMKRANKVDPYCQ